VKCDPLAAIPNGGHEPYPDPPESVLNATLLGAGGWLATGLVEVPEVSLNVVRTFGEANSITQGGSMSIVHGNAVREMTKQFVPPGSYESFTIWKE